MIRSQKIADEILIDLALQGGGAHGAFTWGVLDRLLEEKKLRIDGISGTSAGAMNAVALVDGYTKDGPQGARNSLESFWKKISEAARFSFFQRSPLDILLGQWSLDHSPLFITMDIMSRVFSPYDLNPLGINPLRDILAKTIDFKRLSQSSIKLFVTATNVSTGRGRVFRNNEITPEVLLASACLPTMFKAVEINGEHYWDGGYSGNPTITPLVRECKSQDTILVQINPVTRLGFPQSAKEILNRLNEVSFNAVLLKELRMIALLRQLAHPDNSEGAKWAGMRIHRVSSDIMLELGSSSKLNAEWDFLLMLRDEGRRAAEAFLKEHANDLGRRSSLDLDILLEGV
ncbi:MULTISPECIES: patatin-like phospholipase family protein [Legionella]|uniref:Patatin-like phospholipase family protein n=1 Tax=Legionella resiliens TaxID=2905958 RepID=A0ABS8X8G3_9GAMM|nr:MULTISPECIES: patatin-like phospholipase family protein [unclassified Legionella]MCE0724547.1 patatin-like phospholipase family protein [Legionella sp. 9fVS26]MCE3533700.1 patatin-like phospholipase family protein [Legionella sp. 8cVS16]QLZ69894.1 alpha/beta hydrolase [Legionella sp. PC1000]